MLELARTWGVYIALSVVGFLLPLVTSVAYEMIRTRLDRMHPDTLPVSAGEWLRDQVAQRGLADLRVLIHPDKQGGVDAYAPNATTILLSQLTFRKSDPTYWAIAAHELGHALVHRSARVLAVAFSVARSGKGVLLAIAGTLTLVNTLFRSQELNQVLMSCALGALAFSTVVLVDEAAASVRAMRVLRGDERLGPLELRAARHALWAAFGTYLAGFVGTSVFVLSADAFVAALEQAPPLVAAAPPSRLRLAAAAVTTLMLLLLVARDTRSLRRTIPATSVDQVGRERRVHQRRELTRGAVALVFVALVYDLPYGLLFMFASVLAIRASIRVVVVLTMPLYLLLGLLLFIPASLVAVLLLRRTQTETNGTDAAVPEAEMTTSEAAMTESMLAFVNQPPLRDRLARAFAVLGTLPVVVIFWMRVLLG